jgi:hypothetical protein
VPITALSVGADGSSRLQVQRGGGRSEYVSVEPGLAAQGLVEVRPVKGSLNAGDLVIVGKRDGGGGAPPAGNATNGATGATGRAGSTGATGSTGGGGSSGSRGASGTTGSAGGSQRSGATDGTSPGSGTTP